MKKRILGIMLMTILLIQITGALCTVSAWEIVMMYAADGRRTFVKSDVVEAYKEVGWFTQPPVLMYATDGRTLYVSGDEVSLYQSLGWYLEPMCTVYAPNDAVLVIPQAELQAYIDVGWFTQPPVLMYAADGRTLYVSGDAVEGHKEVGWFTQPPVLMYAVGGRTCYVSGDEIEIYKEVGWYTQPPVLMYAADGRTLYVSGDEVSLYQSLGWYLEPVCKVYAPYDAILVIPQRELQAYIDVGWSTTYDEALYNQIIPDIQTLMKQKDYEAVIEECEYALYMFDDYNVFYQDIESRMYAAMDTWRNKIKAPLVVLDGGTLTYDGKKYASISLRNISYKTIVAFELEFECYNIFMDPVQYYNYGSSLYKGYSTEDSLYTLDAETFYWELSGYSKTEHIKNIKIKRVAFSDGTVWTA